MPCLIAITVGSFHFVSQCLNRPLLISLSCTINLSPPFNHPFDSIIGHQISCGNFDRLTMTFNLLERRQEKFVLWIPAHPADSYPPQLVLGTLDIAPNATFNQIFKGPLSSAARPDVWELDPKSIKPTLTEGVYRYWFEIQDSSPEDLGTIQVTDPLAHTVDYRTTTDRGDHDQPASVIKFRDGKLWTCDIDGAEPKAVAVQPQSSMSDNNQLVIYGMTIRSLYWKLLMFSELPASWVKSEKVGGVEVDIGTFTGKMMEEKKETDIRHSNHSL